MELGGPGAGAGSIVSHLKLFIVRAITRSLAFFGSRFSVVCVKRM